jgi:hypothetical protein
MVLGIALLLVVGIAKLLGGGGSPGTAGEDRAANAADTSPPGSTSGTDPGSTSGGQAGHHQGSTGDPVTPVTTPSGHCSADDVGISPSVPRAIGGRNVAVVLDLSSLMTPACTWTLSSSSLAMKITSGPDLIWSTAQCAHAIASQDLVLRQGAPTRVRLTWDARRSEPGCPDRTAWALPGTYHLEVAALGGQPQDDTFLLTSPPAGSTQGSTQGSTSHQGKHDPEHHGKHKKKHPIPPG